MSLPKRVRRWVLPPIAAGLAAASARRPGWRFLALGAFIAQTAAAHPDRAVVVARRSGTLPASSARTRRELALLTREVGHSGVALEIFDTISDDRAPSLTLLRSQWEYQRGRYRDALDAGLEAERLGIAGAHGAVARAAGELRLLDPGWAPDLGPAESALRDRRGQVSRGRIVHLVTMSLPFQQVGYTLRTRSVVRSQRDAGLDAMVVTPAGYPRAIGVSGAAAEATIDGVPYIRVDPDHVVSGGGDEKLTERARATVAVIEALRPAALQPASNHLQARLALALARPLGIPVVYEVRGFWEESWAANRLAIDPNVRDSDRYRLTRAVETAAMTAADAVVTLSEAMRQEIIERGCRADRITVIPNAIEVDRLTPVPRDDALGSSLGIEPGDPVIGYISSFTAYEGIPILLEAATRLRDQGQRLRVLLVGDGDAVGGIRAAVRRLGLDDGTVVMPGRVPHDQIARYYSLIDVFVVPRTADRVTQLVPPLKPFEAMALERAVVVSDLPVLREIVTEDETGLTFRAGDPDDLARVLSDLLGDADRRRRLGRQARAWILAERTWAHNGRRYRELYERLGVI